MNNWRFVKTPSGHWLWQYTNVAGVQCISERYFAIRRDCVADAMRHGFPAPPAQSLVAGAKNAVSRPSP